MILKNWIPLIWLGGFLFILNAAEAASSDPEYQLIGTYDVARLNQILSSELKNFSSFPVRYSPARFPVKLYRIRYASVIPEQSNRPTVASGLLAVPQIASHPEGQPLPVVSYQHGTVFSKKEVPSHPDESMETRLMLAQFAGQGYVVIAADYFGKGESPEPDSYLVKASTQQACLDNLLAAKAVSAKLKVIWGPLFLSGWSQGGWATMVFLNKLESEGIPVKAAATASAPNDLFAIINGWLHAPSKLDATFLPALLCLQLNSYAEYYGLPGLDKAIRPKYRKTARDLYLNQLTWEQASPKLPTKLTDLLREEFVAASSLGRERFWKLLQDNQAYRWRSRTPLRTYFGGVDEVTSEYIATLPVAYQKAVGGAKTSGIASGKKANHRGNFVHAVADQKKWFDQLIKK